MKKTFFYSQRGATSIEYALIAALIAIAMLAGLTIAGTRTATQYNNVANTVGKAMK